MFVKFGGIGVFPLTTHCDGSLVRGKYMGVTYEMREGGERGSILTWD